MTSMQSPATPPPRHEMMFLPVEDDALVFQICFYYGLLVVFLEVVVPLVFHRRLRLILPSFLPEAPVLSDDDFQQQKTTLEEQLRMQRLTSARKKKQQQQSLKKLVRGIAFCMCVCLRSEQEKTLSDVVGGMR